MPAADKTTTTPDNFLRQHSQLSRWSRVAVLLGAGCCATQAFAQCPALQPYYPTRSPATAGEWAAKLPAIEAQLESCLRSAEYFALLGAAQLNTGQAPQALESLERALLLEPDNGAAQIDYAESLFLTGQLFAAIELNARLLERQDLPANLPAILQVRQQLWQQQTRHRQFMLEATGGYDNNLNGAPANSNVTLTLEGVPVTLTLGQAFQPEKGAFANLRAGGDWQWLAPTHQQDLLATVRLRKAPVGDNDLAQADWRYTFILPARHHQWEFSTGTSHMLYSGNPLYSIGEAKARFVWGEGQCKPSLEAGLQKLHYHDQAVMDGLEGSLTAGFGCTFPEKRQQLRLEAGVLGNQAQSASRPGGDRDGWNARLNWQWQLGRHELSAQWGYASLDDQRGYSPLLDNNSAREIHSEYISLRYRRMLSDQIGLLINLSHQEQRSNLEPFRNRGTVGELGLSINF